ncbi:hypothetical protein HDV00_004127 [Rhizophlyctis rosea]|nr:hypothetical protein HDV00_004127 [Rhizophlyctis rosea]
MSIKIDFLPAPGQTSKSLFYGVPNTPHFGVNAILRITNDSKKFKNIYQASVLVQCKTRTLIESNSISYGSASPDPQREKDLVNLRWLLVAEPGVNDLPIQINLNSSVHPNLPSSGTLSITGDFKTRGASFSARYPITAEISIPQKRNPPKVFTRKIEQQQVNAGIWPPIPQGVETGWRDNEAFAMMRSETSPLLDLTRTPKTVPYNLTFTLPTGPCIRVNTPHTLNFHITPHPTKNITSLTISIKQFISVWADSLTSGAIKTTSSTTLLTQTFTAAEAQGGSLTHPQVREFMISPKVAWKESWGVESLIKVHHELRVEVGVEGEKEKKENRFIMELRVVRPVGVDG